MLACGFHLRFRRGGGRGRLIHRLLADGVLREQGFVAFFIARGFLRGGLRGGHRRLLRAHRGTRVVHLRLCRG